MTAFLSAGELIAPGKEELMMICIPAKRETGERPVRPRHCDGVEYPAIPLIRRTGKGGYLMMPEPGDLHKASVAHASRGGSEYVVYHLWPCMSEVFDLCEKDKE